MRETIESIITESVERIESLVRTSILASLGGAGAAVSKQLVRVGKKAGEVVKAIKARKKGPVQLCPSPGCRSPAAPVFGMLCKQHKGAPKAMVTKWREARRKKAAKS